LFGMAVFGLFSYLRNATVVTTDHLFTAASIYLLLAAMWFAIYKAVETIHPFAFEQTLTGAIRPQPDLLYFSLVTLTTLGYGDIVPIGAEVRMLAGLEAAVGVLYVAITVALLVSAYRPQAEP
jgi:voltage-gated potassium channel